MNYIVQCVALHYFLFTEVMGRADVAAHCSTQYHRAEVRRAPCCVLSAIQLPAVLSWGPPKASHLSSRTTSSDTRPIEINAPSASGSSFLCLSKFQRGRYASSALITPKFRIDASRLIMLRHWYTRVYVWGNYCIYKHFLLISYTYFFKKC